MNDPTTWPEALALTLIAAMAFGSLCFIFWRGTR